MRFLISPSILSDHGLCHIAQIPLDSTFSRLLYEILSRLRHGHSTLVCRMDGYGEACQCLHDFFDFKTQAALAARKHIAVSDAI